jgi:hypothetical protein
LFIISPPDKGNLIPCSAEKPVTDKESNRLHSFNTSHIYDVGSKSFWPDIQKLHQMENAVRDI